MLAEDTDEHHEIFGREGEAALYFRNADEASAKATWLANNPQERVRMAAAIRTRAGGVENTYRARLATMLDVAAEVLRPAHQPGFAAAAQ
jgi:spore maturation protein CgeB